ncbi:hypothetical protein F3Y22_tig00002919pilonHSYRG00343 [Hibiscus syriacus]|uniref:Uncharacterized protein n=1 Tax=Hibiscus syriacus TaxID=106335 RepID=A0A6A3CQD2_HIBSY|nr:hypothetical protein F3Y22_tig00002919pilonHSYRG00343 [Hibiscus syriacus]
MAHRHQLKAVAAREVDYEQQQGLLSYFYCKYTSSTAHKQNPGTCNWHSFTSSRPCSLPTFSNFTTNSRVTLSPGASKALGSESDTPLDLEPASPPEENEEPEAPSAMINPGIRPVIQPSASSPSYVSPPLLLTLLIGVTIFKFN